MRLPASRRAFLRASAAVAATVVMPSFLAGCGVRQAMEPARPVPDAPFLDWFAIDAASLSGVFAVLAGNGADMADVYLQHRRECSLEMRKGVVDQAGIVMTQGAGMRVIAGERSGYAFTEDLARDAMIAAAGVAAERVSGIARVPPIAFEPAPQGDLYVVTLPWTEIVRARKVRIMERLDRQARAADPSVSEVSISWSDVDERILVATLDGRLVGDQRPMTRLAVQVIAVQNGRRETGFANMAARGGIDWYTDARVDALARDAVERTLMRFEAGGAPSGDMPVVLAAGSSGVLLHEAIGHTMEADFVQERASPYAGRIGETIAHESITLVDESVAGQCGAVNYDDEGNRCRRNVMVENGVLRAFLNDTVTARRAAMPITASGRRESYRFAPLPRMTCTFIENGAHSREEIIAAVEHGVVAETYATGQVQPGRGDFSFRVGNGWLVENGKVTAPIKDFSISGNGPEMLRAISMVAGDGYLDPGGWVCGKKGQQIPVSQGMPSVLVSTLRVNGDLPANARYDDS